MLEDDIIEPSSSQYLNPIVTVVKKDGSVRICLDARLLNSRIAPDQQRPEVIDDLMQRFSGRKWFTSVDLSSSFWQVPLKVEDRPYTAFAYRSQLYQFTRIPFGTRTSSSGLIRAIQIALGNDTLEYTNSYIDDLVIASYTFQDHIQHLETVFGKLRRAGFTLKLSKSTFCTQQINFLSHTITAQGITPCRTKLEEIYNTQAPRNVKQLRSFLGVCNFFRKFVIKYADRVEPFRNLLKKGTPWEWNPDYDVAFERLKDGFKQASMLRHPEFDKEFILMTDASEKGVAGVLCQRDDAGDLGLISLVSRGLSMAEKKYTVTEQELLAIKYSVEKLRQYLLGKQFQIWTDHNALTFIKNCKITSNRVSRWILTLQEYDFEIKHIKGTDNIIADFVSRNPMQDNVALEIRQQNEFLICGLNLKDRGEERNKLIKMKQEQKMDRDLKNILDELVTTEPGQSVVRGQKEFKIEDGYLKKSCGEDGWKIVVPKSLRNEIIWFTHKEMGHFGAEKVGKAIREHFVWRGMSREIRKTLATCDLCQRCKHPNRTLEGPKQAVITENIHELVCVDLYGPLVKTRYGCQYIFVLIDSFSKYIKLYPLKAATAKACVNIVTKRYINEVGKPHKILSDNGTQFTSGCWKNNLKELGIKNIYSSVRYPQGNMCERPMRELGRIFRTYVGERHNSWFDLLPEIEKWINCSSHESTGLTPIEIHFGRKPHRELCQILDLPREESKPQEVYIELARRNLNKAGEKRRKLQKKDIPDEFQLGDEVLLRVPHMSCAEQKTMQKFFQLYKGPFIVEKRIGLCAYSLVDDAGKNIGTHNIHNLKKYYRKS